MSATPMRSLAHSSRCADRSPVRHTASSAIPPAALHLSDRQADCLKWSAAGKTSWETSRILGVSESTVNFHLRNACNRLGVRGRRAAVVAALRLGLLEFKA
nr:helix-turn-helix domain-containing protein [Achromobacter mucicolens]